MYVHVHVHRVLYLFRAQFEQQNDVLKRLKQSIVQPHPPAPPTSPDHDRIHHLKIKLQDSQEQYKKLEGVKNNDSLEIYFMCIAQMRQLVHANQSLERQLISLQNTGITTGMSISPTKGDTVSHHGDTVSHRGDMISVDEVEGLQKAHQDEVYKLITRWFVYFCIIDSIIEAEGTAVSEAV